MTKIEKLIIIELFLACRTAENRWKKKPSGKRKNPLINLISQEKKRKQKKCHGSSL